MTFAVSPSARSLSDVLHDSGRRFADRPALRGAGITLTYAELDGVVDRLAATFRAAGAEPGRPVGLCVARGPLALAASAALMRAGCAYLPIDPALPAERLRHILGDAGLVAAVADPPGREALAHTPLGILDVSADDLVPGRVAGPVPPGPDPTADAYVMYTSGSTGRPKGVPVTHANVLALLTDALPLFRYGSDEIWPLQHAHGFDVSVWEMWAGIAVGATLVPVEGEVARDAGQLAELLLRNRTTRLHIVPSVFDLLAEVVAEEDLRVPLRAVTFCGEAVNYRAMRTWSGAHPGLPAPVWLNSYGITETTVYNTFKEITGAEVTAADPATPIGHGYAHSPVVVLDDDLVACPPGRPGEIFIGGAQVARGYLGNPELTARRFLSLPGRPGRWYRTGDFGYVGAEGGLRYVGRQDDQVKVRGFRIELGELDHAARALPWIADAAAVLGESARGEPVLTLFVVTTAEVPDLRERVRRALRERLPEHMVPGAVVGLPRLPRNTNGKRDRRALRDLLAR